jgi:hypothetical protein
VTAVHNARNSPAGKSRSLPHVVPDSTTGAAAWSTLGRASHQQIGILHQADVNFTGGHHQRPGCPSSASSSLASPFLLLGWFQLTLTTSEALTSRLHSPNYPTLVLFSVIVVARETTQNRSPGTHRSSKRPQGQKPKCTLWWPFALPRCGGGNGCWAISPWQNDECDIETRAAGGLSIA